MRSRRRRILIGLLAVTALTVLAVWAFFPLLLRGVIGTQARKHLVPDFQYERIALSGPRTLRFYEPRLIDDGRILLEAKTLDLKLSYVDRRFELSRVTVANARFDLTMEDLESILRPSPEGAEESAMRMEIIITETSGHLGALELDNLTGDLILEANAGELTLTLRKVAAGTPWGEFVSEGLLFWRDDSLDSATVNASLDGAPLKLWYDGLYHLTAEEISEKSLTKITESVWALSGYDPELGGAADFDPRDLGVERLQWLELETDLKTFAVGMVRGVAVSGYPAQINSARFRWEAGRLTLHDIAARVRVAERETDLKFEGYYEDGLFVVPTMTATADGLFLSGSDVKISNGKISATLDRFTGRVEGVPVTGHGELSGNLASPDFTGQVSLSGFRFEYGTVRLSASLNLRDIVTAAVGSVRVTGGEVVLLGHALAVQPTAAVLRGGVLVLSEPLRLIGEKIEAAATGRLSPSGADVSFTARAQDLGLDEFGLEGYTAGNVWMEGDETGPSVVTANSVTGPDFSVDTLLYRPTAARILVEAGGFSSPYIDVSAARIVIADREEVSEGMINGTIKDSLPVGVEFAGGEGRLNLGDESFTGRMNFRLAGNGVVFDVDEMTGPSGRFGIRGSAGKEGIKLAGTVDLKIETLIDEISLFAPEIVGGSGGLTGNFTVGESTEIVLRPRSLAFNLQNGTSISDLAGEIRYTARSLSQNRRDVRVELASVSGKTPGGALQANGMIAGVMVGDDWKALRSDLALSGEDFGIASLAAFEPALKAVEGNADFNLSVSGPLGKPDIDGVATVRNVRTNIEGVGALEQGFAELSFNDGLVRIDTATANFGGGRVIASGRWEIGTGGNITGTLSNARLSPVPGVEGSISGKFDLMQRSGELPRLKGDIQVSSARGLIDELARSKNVISEAKEPMLALDLNLSLSEFRLFNPEMVIYVSGTLHVGGTDAEPTISGTLNGQRGQMRSPQGIFRIERATIQIAESGQVNVNALAVTKVGSVRIFARVSGDPAELTPEFYSEPPKSQDEILAMLAFGQEIPESGDPLALGRSVTLSVSQIAGVAPGEAGLIETIKLEKAAGDTGTGAFSRVSFGGQISDRVYIGYSQPTSGEGGRALEVEYEISPRLNLQFEAGTNGTSGVALEWSKEY